MLNQDDRPPRIQISVSNQNFADGDVVSSEPDVQAFISDENGVDVLTRELGIFISKDGEDFEPAGKDDYDFHWDTVSNDVPVNYWPGKLEPGEYEVRFEAYDFNGNSGSRTAKFVVKREFELGKDSLMNYPNPFQRETDITFQLTSVADDAVVKIYTVSGRLIRTLEQSYAVNFVVIHWDGRDEDGKEVANGVYYYKIRLKREGRKDIVETGKMLKLK
jgi:flagellar hook assembly protein FlgD